MGRGSAQDDDGEADSALGSDFDSVLRQAQRVGDDLLGPALPQLGQIIGEKYRLEERLGRGGMGAVYRATHLVSEKPVALKWMLRSNADEHARRRFLREARVAGRIDHPNVVDVYDIGEQGDGGYLVMELLRGESLRERMARGKIAPAELVGLLLPAMRGVAAVHRAGVVHRDLKPDNIFLCTAPDGQPREAKVLDFGISAMTAADPNDPTLTKDGALLGTPAYMSPEQLQSSRDADARSDVYSFGVIMYEALAGTLPFDAPSHNALVLAIVNREPKPLGELRPDLPHELCAVVMRALAKQPAARFASVDALSVALAPDATAPSGNASEGTLAPLRGEPRPKRTFALALVLGLVLSVAAYLLRDREMRVNHAAEGAPAPAAPPERASIEPAPERAPVAVPAAQAPRTAQAGPTTLDSRARTSEQETRTSVLRKPKPAAERRTIAAPRHEPGATKQRSGRISVDDL